VPDESISLCIDSHPYFGLRKYPNQNELCHGQEKTVEEYIANFIKFCREKKKKLKKGGVLVTIIGETYKGGYKGICTKVETALVQDGWIILDVNIWVKKNGKYTPHPHRFINSYERIIVAYKPGANPSFNEVNRNSSTGKYVMKPTSSGGAYLATPKSCITNVIETAVHNLNELTVIDSNFKHEAPCPEAIYRVFIEAYSQVGDFVLDSFIGSSTAAVGLEMGRSIIGYDVDPESIEFSQKRCEEFLKKYEQNQLSQAA
jgi:site-specific DNA-methyltransferase (adenine-specific)/site-specific DNA-methyltransferase (cytosine-N4-specific)